MKTNCQFSLLVHVLFLNVIHVIGQRSIVLDKQTDLFRAWKLKGHIPYYTNGYELDYIRPDLLPTHFDFKPFRTTKGIWAVVPTILSQVDVNPPVMADNSKSSQTYNVSSGIQTLNTTASITFTSAAQLMESVKVRYFLYGKARILIKRGESQVLYIIAPSEIVDFNWVEMKVPLSGSSQFIVEAHVQIPQDIVLIDRIDGFYSETTTSTTRRPSTSPRTHPPTPKSTGNSLAAQNYFITVLSLNLVLLLGCRNI